MHYSFHNTSLLPNGLCSQHDAVCFKSAAGSKKIDHHCGHVLLSCFIFSPIRCNTVKGTFNNTSSFLSFGRKRFLFYFVKLFWDSFIHASDYECYIIIMKRRENHSECSTLQCNWTLNPRWILSLFHTGFLNEVLLLISVCLGPI